MQRLHEKDQQKHRFESKFECRPYVAAKCAVYIKVIFEMLMVRAKKWLSTHAAGAQNVSGEKTTIKTTKGYHK